MVKISSFGKITPLGLSKAKLAARESVTEYERLLLDVCCKPHQDAIDFMKTREAGLNETEVEFLRAKWGANHLGHHKKHSFLAEILMRCKNPLVIQLLVIAVISIATGNLASAIIVSAMVVISVGLSYYQESRSNKAVEKLNEMVQSSCHVLRENQEVELPISEIVPGDIVVHPLRLDIGKTRRSSRHHQLRPGNIGLHLADDPIHVFHGRSGLSDCRPHQT